MIDYQNEFCNGRAGQPGRRRAGAWVIASAGGRCSWKGRRVLFTRDTHGTDYLKHAGGPLSSRGALH